MRILLERGRCAALRPGLLAALVLLAAAAPAQAQTFPRGPGFYFSPYNLGIFLAAYFLWIRLCAWMDRDAPAVGLETSPWNPLMVGAGAAGLVALWIAPQFWI